MAKAYMKALTGSEDTKVTFQTFDDSGQKREGLLRVLHGSLDEWSSELTRLNENGGGVFVTVNETDLQGRKATNVVAIRSLFADFDGVEPGHGTTPAFALTPTFIVRSKNGPHPYYPLEPGESLADFTPAQGRLADYYGSDPAVKDLPRVMRLPGFDHRKGDPFRVTLSILSDFRFTIADVMAEHPVTSQVVDARRVEVAAGAQITLGHRRPTIMSFMGGAHRTGAQYEELLALGISTNERCVPKISLKEIESMARNVSRYPPGAPVVQNDEKSVDPNKVYSLSDKGNAEYFCSIYGRDLRYVNDAKKWYVYDGQHWIVDDTNGVERKAKAAIESMLPKAVKMTDSSKRAELIKHALKTESARGIESMVRLARSEAGVSCKMDVFDNDRWLLNCINGTVDLRTGVLRDHSREDMITKMVPARYDPDAKCPTWDSFLDRIMKSNIELIDFLRRGVGYSLTGDVSEQVMFLLWGRGANGKSTFVGTLEAILDGYCKNLPPDTLMQRRTDGGTSTEIAALKGARLVTSVESDEGKSMAEAKVKQMLGGDSITARFLFQDFITFKPEFKLWFAANHRPQIKSGGEAIWRRIHLVPFTEFIPVDQRDVALPIKLGTELDGILAWAIAGCLEWQKAGLRPPEEVRAATAEYREEEDILAAFIDERCAVADGLYISKTDLYVAYVAYQEASKERPISKKLFCTRMADKNFNGGLGRQKHVLEGISLKTAAGIDGPREPPPPRGLPFMQSTQDVGFNANDGL